MSGLLSFPNPVNEKAARIVAGVVAIASAVTLLTGWYWLLVPIAYGFVARVLTGPKLSPLGWFASRVVAPRLGEPVHVAGPPKRFAQGMGAVCTVAAALFALALGWHAAADVVLAMMVVFADARIRVRAVRRLQDLRPADDARARARADLRGLLGPQPQAGAGTGAVEQLLGLRSAAPRRRARAARARRRSGGPRGSLPTARRPA